MNIAKKLTRRRFISITASAMALGSGLSIGKVLANSKQLYQWRGVALGAQTEVLLNLDSKAEGEKIVSAIMAEVQRLERIFSIYRADSELTRLNETGYLENPSFEMVDLLSKASLVSDLTKGAFDISVQPLWQLYQQAKDQKQVEKHKEAVLELVNYRNIHIDQKEIRFLQPGMAITLNGIAQGYVTDKVATLLKAQGLTHSLLQLGETRALDTHPSGRPWAIQAGNHSDGMDETVHLGGGLALSTSAADQGMNRIFDPELGIEASRYKSISVIDNTATMADAFSTAFSVMPQTEIEEIAANHEKMQVFLTRI